MRFIWYYVVQRIFKLNMLSLDDANIFWMYERNRTVYYRCSDITTCPTRWIKECFCHCYDTLRPITIGYTWVPPDLSVRSYIKWGEICCICFDPIWHKRTALLTECGHAYHRGCMQTMYEIGVSTNKHYDFCCPMCRKNLGISPQLRRYNNWYNSLDRLEDFWTNGDISLCIVCNTSREIGVTTTHHLGMRNDCAKCRKYRIHGSKHTLIHTI